MSLNRVIIIGRLGQDPELKYLPSGGAVCNMSVATSESWKDKETGQKQEKTEWHRVIVFGKTAENCAQYLAKGRQVFLEGKLQTRSWEDKDGVKKYATEIVAQQVQFLDSISGDNGGQKGLRPQSNNENAQFYPRKQSEPQAQANINFTADDIPF